MHILIHKIETALNLLEKNIRSNNFSGYDPYDTLQSPIFTLKIFQNHYARFYGQQIGKRFPVHLQKILNIPKTVNPVTLGLCYLGYYYLLEVYPERKQEFLNNQEKIFSMLLEFPTKKKENVWGYEFDWEARYAKIDAYTPNAVVTGIVTNSLYVGQSLLNPEELERIFFQASNFILQNLKREDNNGNLFFSYSPMDSLKVFNAHMKSVRVLSQYYKLSGNTEILNYCKQGVDFLIQNQNDDGSWNYAPNEKRNWPDNYHNAYILDCLDDYIANTEDEKPLENLSLGVNFYVNNFFSSTGEPKKLAFKNHYVDSTSIGQSLLTLCRFNHVDLAFNVANWAIENFQEKSGGFYYQKSKYFTDRRIFMRWSNAWMMAGLSMLLNRLKNPSESKKDKI